MLVMVVMMMRLMLMQSRIKLDVDIIFFPRTFLTVVRTRLRLCACLPVGSPCRAQGMKPTLVYNHLKINVPKSFK